MARLRLIRDQVKELEAARAERLEAAPASGQNAMVRLLARVIGVGVETADMLVHEVLSRGLRDRRAVARYASLTGAPDESGARRREKESSSRSERRARHAWARRRFSITYRALDSG
jgi:transposase